MMIRAIRGFLWRIIRMITLIFLWFMLMVGISLGMSEYQKEYYTPTDTPNPRFMVGGQYWQDFKDNPKPLDLTPDTECLDSCLRLLNNGHYEYVNDSPLIITYSKFQIKGNQIIPISFKALHVGHLFYGAIGAFFGLWLISYGITISQLRNDKRSLTLYHQKLGKQLLILGAWVIIIIMVAKLTAKP